MKRIFFSSFILASVLSVPTWAATSMDPTGVFPLRLEYHFSDLRLRGGDEIVLNIPKGFKVKPIDFVFITHKQDPKDENECRSIWDGTKTRDCLPAYTSFEVLDANAQSQQEEWRYWGGAGSGPLNSKFAEIRPYEGETDNLYEWRKKGHFSVETNRGSKSPLVPAAFRVRSLGKDSLILQDVVVKLLPPPPSEYEEVIFSSGFAFGEYDTAEGRKYPGRASRGDYGSALDFKKPRTPRHDQLPNHWNIDQGEISIPLKKGKRLLFVDIAAGDMAPVPSGGNPEDYRGGAKLTVKLNDEVLAHRENIGTSGVLRMSPHTIQKAKDGDVLILKASSKTVHIMGIRLGYDNF